MKIVISATALADLETITEYIAQDNADAAKRLRHKLEQKIYALPRNPFIYKSGRIKNTREMLVSSCYMVVYAVEKDCIRIIRILHTA